MNVTVHGHTAVSCNILEVQVGTNCPQGGDSGHGGRTVLRLINHASTTWNLRVQAGYSDKLSAPIEVQRVDLLFAGDTECDTLVECLEFALRTLRAQKTSEHTSAHGLSDSVKDEDVRLEYEEDHGP